MYFLYILFFVHMLNYCSVRFRISNTLESNHVSLILFDIRWLCYFCCGFLNRKQETGNSKHRRANQTVGQMQHVLHFVIGCCYAADGFLLLLPDTADSLSCIVQKFNYNLYFFFLRAISAKSEENFLLILLASARFPADLRLNVKCHVIPDLFMSAITKRGELNRNRAEITCKLITDTACPDFE